MTPQEKQKAERLIGLAERGANDADLVLLDKIDELDTKIDSVSEELKTDISNLSDKFDSAVQEIKANVPDLNKVLESIKGKDGKDGKDSVIPGPKGNRGDMGMPGKDGMDGEDGMDGTDADMESMMKEMHAKMEKEKAEMMKTMDKEMKKKHELMMEEMQEKIDELEDKVKAIPSAPNRPIFGPGKTKVLLLDLSAQLDGVTKTFAIGSHFGITGVWGSSDPFGAFRPTIDYTEVGRNIVFAAGIDASIALAAGQQLIVQYLK